VATGLERRRRLPVAKKDARKNARKDLLCDALSVSLTDAISLEDGGVGVYAAGSGGKRTLGMARGKPSSKAESAGRKSATAPQAPPKSHAAGKKRRGKTAAAAHLRQAVGRNITERKRAEAALRESEEKYRILFQTMAQGVVYQSADGKILSANPAAGRILGLTLDEMQGRTSIDPRWRAIHEDGSDFPGQTHPAMVALQTGREVRDVVMGIYNPRTESQVWINVNAVPRIEPGDDKPCQVYTTFDDITGRKRAEEETRRFAAFPVENPSPILALSLEGQLLFANPAAVRTFPTLSAEGLRHCIMADWPSVADALRRRSPPIVRREVKVDGAWYLQVFFHAAELDRVLVYLIDITERKQAEESLRESETKFRTVFDGAADGMFVLDLESRKFVISNAACSRMLGFTPEEFRNLSISDLHLPEDLPLVSEQIGMFMKGEAGLRKDVRFKRRDGSTFFADLNPVLISLGGRRGILVAFRDITEHKQAEERVKAYQRRLRSLGAKLAVAEEQERRRIAAGLHDNVVQALVLAKMKLERLAARKSAARISQAILEIRGLVDQSVHDTRSLLFDLSPVALYELGFEPAVESLLERIQTAHRLATRFRTDNRPKPVTSDVRVVLFRGVREVLQNVVKHAQARSVGVSVGRDSETVLVEVQDDGVGFDAHKALSIHDAGGGFGLFDVRERLDYLGGSLTIQSEPGKGTTATLRVPLAPEKACLGGMSHGDSSASG